MSDDRKDLPAVSSDNFLQRVREALQTYMGSQGNVLDRGVTLRDLSDTGLIDLSKSYLTTRRGSPVAGPGPAAGGATPVPDLTPPPTPTGFTVGAGISHLFIGCAPQTYSQGHGHLVTRLYGATWTTGDLPVFADATVLTEFQGTVFAHPTNPATTWHLWITWVTRDGVESPTPAGGTNGLVVTSGQDVSSLLDALTGQITQSQLYADLGARINLIDGTGAGSVNARLLAEAAERNALLSQEALNRSNEFTAEQQQRAAADALEAQTRASALAQQAQNLGNAVVSLTEQIQDGDGALSQRIDSVVATNYSRPNLVAALQAWTFPATFQVLDRGWGEALYTYEDGTEVALSPAIPAFAGAGYVLTYDSLRFADGGSTYMDLQYFDADGLFIGESDQVMRYDVHDFREDDQNRLVNAHYAVAPAGTSTMKVRAVTEAGTGVSAIGWRQPKLERGSLPATRYSSEAQASVATAALRDERSARIAADSAEAQQRSDLAVQLRGNATGSDLGSVTTGLLAQERDARVSADSSLAYQMSMLSAGVGEQFDTSSIWYFDTEGDPEGWTGRGPLTMTGGFMRLPDSTGWANVVSPVGLDVDANTYRQVKMRIRKHGTPVWVGRLMWRSEAEATFDPARSMMVAEPDYDANGIALVTWDLVWSGLIYQLNFDLFQEQQPGGWCEIDWVAVGRPAPGASTAMVVQEQTARAAADNAEADSRERLSVSLTGLTDPTGVPLGSLSSGILAQERNARVAADNAEVIARQNLAVTVNQGLYEANAALQDERRVRADGDAAEASARQAMRAELYSRRNMAADVFEWGPLPTGWTITEVADWGMAVFCDDSAQIPSVGSVPGPAIRVQPGVTYTISGDTVFNAAAGFVAFDLIFENAAGDVILDGAESFRGGIHDFSADGSGRRLTEVAAVAPATAVTATPRFWWGDVTGPVHIGFRQVKVERGGLPSTPYSTEAETQILNANIVEESWVRAQADAAEAYARQQLEASYSANNVELYGRIATEEQTRATADSVASARMDTLSATIITRPNLCPDVDKWTLQTPCYIERDGWGKSLRAINPGNGTYVCHSPEIPCYAGQTYTVTGDSLLFADSGYVYLDLEFKNAAGDIVLDGPQNPLSNYHDHSSANVNRDAHAVSVAAPAGAVKFNARFVAENLVSCQAVGVRQVKVEQGGLPATIYTQEGEVSAVGAALQVESQVRADQTGELYAQYTVKTDVAGLISGYGLASTANNAAPTSSFGVRANAFFVSPPAVASATAPSANLYDGFVWLDTSVVPNVTRYRSGATWVLTPPVLPFMVQATPTTVNGVPVPAGVYANDLFVKNGTITNAKIANLAVDDAKIANLSVSKLDAGSLKVGSYISSSNYVAGSQGFAVWATGAAEFNNVTVRGTVYASSGSFTGNVSANSGSIGGNAIDASGMQSPNYAPGASGWRISSDGTARFMAGNIGAISINANGLNTGGFSGYAWPAAGQNGFHLGPNGMLVGNANNGKYLQLTSDGNIYTPGFNVINGTLTINQANVINTLNVAGNAITAVSAAIGPTGPSTGWPAYTALVMCTLSFYSTGAPILLFSGVQSVGGSNSIPYFGAFVRLVIDGGVRTETALEVTTFNYGDGVYSSSFGGSYSFAPSYITDLGAGWHTAQLQLVTTAAIEPSYWAALPIFSGATISTLETKR